MLASIVLEVDLVLVCIEVSAYLCSALLWELPSRRKKSPYSELFWSAFFQNFPAFALNTARYSVSQRIQNKRGKIAGKMRTTITPNTDTFYAVLTFYSLTQVVILVIPLLYVSCTTLLSWKLGVTCNKTFPLFDIWKLLHFVTKSLLQLVMKFGCKGK